MMVPKLIALTGYKRSGKDTVAEILKEWRYERVAIADPLRDILTAIGWDGSKAELAPCPHCHVLRGRALMQTLGTEGLRRNIWPEIWIDLLERRIEGIDRVVITDCRFADEADAVRSWGGVVWRIERPGCEPDHHASEKGVDDIHPDCTLRNDSTIGALRWTVTEALSCPV